MSLQCPFDESTRNLIDRAAVARMRKGSFLINVARAGIVDYAALKEEFASGISVALPSMFWREPADPSDPMLALDPFVLTPARRGVQRKGDRSAHRRHYR